jgi:nucleoside-diphosphate-sugar epimerase
MSSILFTGFPGFLGSELLPRILARDPEAQAACLVQPKFASLALERAQSITAAHPHLDGRIHMVEGDITLPGLGIAAPGKWKESTVAIYHLAAVYDLSVGRELAMRVNVDGTKRMLDFAAECPSLNRFHYVSTCYVSGKHAGVFSEDDLDCGQSFHNFYEETKFLAEVDVQRRMRDAFPATIYRPAVVVGDSATGMTQKYDGPYSVIRLLLRQPGLAVMPVIGDGKSEVNVVPRDFVLDALTYLSGLAESLGRVYHLADPHPLTVRAMLNELARATQRSVLRIRLPLSLAKASLDHLALARKLIGIPASALDYYVYPGRFATTKTQEILRAAEIRCPRFPEYVHNLVGFVRAHPDISSAAMA